MTGIAVKTPLRTEAEAVACVALTGRSVSDQMVKARRVHTTEGEFAPLRESYEFLLT